MKKTSMKKIVGLILILTCVSIVLPGCGKRIQDKFKRLDKMAVDGLH